MRGVIAWAVMPIRPGLSATPIVAAAVLLAAGEARAGEPAPAQIARTPVAPLSLPDPEPLGAHASWPEPDRPAYYTARAPYLGVGLRVAPGASFRLTGAPGVAFTTDILAVGRFGLHPGREQWGLIPEAGYTWRTPGREHQLSAGLGVGWGMGMDFHTFALMPRFVVDLSGDKPGYGVRTGALWCFAENGFAAEVAHQMIRKEGLVLHDLRFSVSIDLLQLAFVLAGAKV